mgnify:CR=1 FL=1
MNKNNLSINKNFELAVENQQKGDLIAAEDLYNKVLKKDPNHAKAYNNLGIIYVNAFEWDKAEKCFSRALKKTQNHLAIENELNFIRNIQYLIKLENDGDFITVIENAEKLISREPKKIEPYLYCLKSLIKLKKASVARHICKIIKVMGGKNILQNFSKKENILYD